MTTIATAFATLPLSAAMLANLDALGYAQMTPIQAQSLPVILKGMDLIAQAKTGSGKTAAFGIGLLNPINPRYFGCQALVLCPTRELADQVTKELRRLARAEDNIKILTLCGGVSLGPQIASLEHGAHIIVGTPGRIQQHLSKGTLVLDGLNTLILDEADRMLDMGFYDAIADIIGQTPKRRQTLLFSATYPSGIKQLASSFMRDPQTVKVETLHADSQIEQHFYEITPEQRMEAVTKVLGHFRPQSCVAFCFTKQQCQELVEHLQAKGISAQALHGDLEQRDRDQVLTLFANRSLSVLVATDVAARGLDIDALDMVINVELARDAEIHVHRVGRTGRAGERSGHQPGRPGRRPPCPGHRRHSESRAALGTAGQPQGPERRSTAADHEHPVHCCRAQGQTAPGRYPRRLDRRRRIAGHPSGQDRHFRLPGLCCGGTRGRQTGAAAPEQWQDQGPVAAGAHRLSCLLNLRASSPAKPAPTMFCAYSTCGSRPCRR